MFTHEQYHKLKVETNEYFLPISIAIASVAAIYVHDRVHQTPTAHQKLNNFMLLAAGILIVMVAAQSISKRPDMALSKYILCFEALGVAIVFLELTGLKLM
jgi:hypothetical protein